MAGSTIAKLNVMLLANIGGFASSMASAAKPLAGFASNVLSTSAKVTGLVSAITGLVGAGSLAALVHHSMEAIDTNAKLADRLGMTTEGLTGLQHAASLAGVSNESLTGAMEKMLKALGGAADDGELTSNVFKKLGLDAAALANMPADEAFAQIAQKLSEIKNPAERATAAMQIFGKSGQSLLPLLMSGAEGIKAAQDEARRLGLTFNRIDAAKVEAANDSFTRLQGVVTGVGNQLAIALAPYIDAGTAKLVQMATEGGGIGPKVGGAVEWVAKSVAYLSDYLNVLVAGWNVLRGAGSYALGSILDVLGLVVGGIEWLYEKVTGTSSHIGDGMQSIAKAILATGDEAFQKAGENWQAFMDRTNSKTVSRAFDDLRASSQAAAEGVAKNAAAMSGKFQNLEDNVANLKKVSDALDALQKQVDQFGMTEGQKKLMDLSAMGASPEQIEQAKQLADQLDSLNAAKKKSDDMQSKAKEVIDATRTPMEKYESKIGELGELLNSGAIDWEVYGRAVRQARAELEKSGDTPDLKAPDLLKAGSAAAARFVYDANRGSKTLGRDDAQKKALAEAETQSKWLDRIERNTRPDATEAVDI